ncbi:MAG: OsmC family protein, partial [Planctomycetota bacterium]
LATFVTDAPVDNEGLGAAFSPTDLVATALGSCMLTIMGIYAKHHDLDLGGTRVQVTKHMAAQPTRRIGRLEVRFRVKALISKQDQSGLIRAAETCPVAKSLHDQIDIETSFDWGQRL